MKYLEVIDTNGNVWQSVPKGEPTQEEVASMVDILQNWHTMHYLSLDTKFGTYYFNPANVIAATIKDTK